MSSVYKCSTFMLPIPFTLFRVHRPGAASSLIPAPLRSPLIKNAVLPWTGFKQHMSLTVGIQFDDSTAPPAI